MIEELKPCPFCGAPAKSITMGSPGITCSKGCCYIFGKTKTEVVERWNERRAEDELNKIIDKFAWVGTDVYHRVRAEFYEDASVRADWRELMHTYRKEWVI
jgi:hypothetical protein